MDWDKIVCFFKFINISKMRFSKKYTIAAAILLVAFITNPGKEKHVKKASEVFSEQLSSEEGTDLLAVAMGSLLGTIIGYKMELDNFLFFTTSSIRSKKRDKTLLCSVGFFGQVIWVASENDVEDFTSDHAEKGILKSPGKKLEKAADIEQVDPALRAVFQRDYKFTFSVFFYRGRHSKKPWLISCKRNST